MDHTPAKTKQHAAQGLGGTRVCAARAGAVRLAVARCGPRRALRAGAAALSRHRARLRLARCTSARMDGRREFLLAGLDRCRRRVRRTACAPTSDRRTHALVVAARNLDAAHGGGLFGALSRLQRERIRASATAPCGCEHGHQLSRRGGRALADLQFRALFFCACVDAGPARLVLHAAKNRTARHGACAAICDEQFTQRDEKFNKPALRSCASARAASEGY